MSRRSSSRFSATTAKQSTEPTDGPHWATLRIAHGSINLWDLRVTTATALGTACLLGRWYFRRPNFYRGRTHTTHCGARLYSCCCPPCPHYYYTSRQLRTPSVVVFGSLRTSTASPKIVNFRPLRNIFHTNSKWFVPKTVNGCSFKRT